MGQAVVALREHFAEPLNDWAQVSQNRVRTRRLLMRPNTAKALERRGVVKITRYRSAGHWHYNFDKIDRHDFFDSPLLQLAQTAV